MIIGNGAAGISAAEAIRSVDPDTGITIVSGEKCNAYSKVLLHYYIDSRIPERSLFIRTGEFYQKLRIDLLLGCNVESVSPAAQEVRLADGSRRSYDKLLIATGSAPVIPRLKNSDHGGAFTMWTLADARDIITASAKCRDGIIVGGSFVGMQALDTLKRKGLKVRVVEMAERIMPNILDDTGAQMLQDHLKRNGVELLLGNSATEIHPSDACGKTVRLADGESLQAGLCIISVGARPNLPTVDGSSLSGNVGLSVDSHMQTRDPNIYAAGDVAEVTDCIDGGRKVFGLWSTAVEQGRIAGLNMAGRAAEYSGGLDMNAINVLGIPLLTFGKTNCNEKEEELESVNFMDRRRGVYRRFMIRQGVLIGAILMGQVNDGGRIGSLIRSKCCVDASRIKFSLGELRDRASYLTDGGNISKTGH